jgi:hypothetical protein
MIDHGRIGWASIARESRGTSAGHRLDIAVGRYFSDAVVVRVGNVNRALVNGDTLGLAKDGRQRRSAISNKIIAGNSLNGIRLCGRGCGRYGGYKPGGHKSGKAKQKESGGDIHELSSEE